MAGRGDGLALLGRDPDALARSARDRAVLGASQVATAECDLLAPASFGAALDAATAALGGVDTIVLSAADFARPEALDADPAHAARLVAANFANSVAFCEEARTRLVGRGGGTLCVFSSVA